MWCGGESATTTVRLERLPFRAAIFLCAMIAVLACVIPVAEPVLAQDSRAASGSTSLLTTAKLRFR